MFNRRLLIVPAALLLLLFAAAAGAASAPPAKIGGPPPYPVNELSSAFQLPKSVRNAGPQRTGPEVLLGIGHREQLEIVGYRSGKRACIAIANRQVRSSSTGCGGAFLPPEGRSIIIDGTEGTGVGRSGGRLSQVEGSLSPAVAEVRLLYPLGGKMRHSRAVVARVQGSLLAAIGLKRPFGAFAATYHGCSSKVKVTALGDNGEVLESTSLLHGLLHLRVPCKGSGGDTGAYAE